MMKRISLFDFEEVLGVNFFVSRVFAVGWIDFNNNYVFMHD